MKWYWEIRGGHTHVRVFMNHGKCGDLVFRNEEFNQVKQWLAHDSIAIEFIEEVKDNAG